MSVDPIQLIVQSRPQLGDVPGAGEGVTATQGQLRRAVEFDRGNLDDLSAMPGSPGYTAKMATLKSQALARGDPEEIRALQQERDGLLLPQGPVLPPEPTPASDVAGRRRVAIYYGKNDTYNLVIETSPDWDSEYMFRGRNKEQIEMLVDLAVHLGIRVTDKSGDFS